MVLHGLNPREVPVPEVSALSVSESAVHAVVIRANGKVENLGLISFHSRNPLRRWAYQLGQFLGIWRR